MEQNIALLNIKKRKGKTFVTTFESFLTEDRVFSRFHGHQHLPGNPQKQLFSLKEEKSKRGFNGSIRVCVCMHV